MNLSAVVFGCIYTSGKLAGYLQLAIKFVWSKNKWPLGREYIGTGTAGGTNSPPPLLELRGERAACFSAKPLAAQGLQQDNVGYRMPYYS